MLSMCWDLHNPGLSERPCCVSSQAAPLTFACCAQKAAGYGSIKLVQMKGADSDWMGMTNKYGEAWEVPVTPKLPWDFRIVGDDGQEVTDRLPTDRCYSLPCRKMVIQQVTACAKVLHAEGGEVLCNSPACQPVLLDGCVEACCRTHDDAAADT